MARHSFFSGERPHAGSITQKRSQRNQNKKHIKSVFLLEINRRADLNREQFSDLHVAPDADALFLSNCIKRNIFSFFSFSACSDSLSSRQLVVASRSRSLSQTFWAHHQAADGGVHASTTMQGALARLEAEIVGLRTENSR